MSWIYLIIAGLFEVGWPLGFKLASTHTKYSVYTNRHSLCYMDRCWCSRHIIYRYIFLWRQHKFLASVFYNYDYNRCYWHKNSALDVWINKIYVKDFSLVSRSQNNKKLSILSAAKNLLNNNKKFSPWIFYLDANGK